MNPAPSQRVLAEAAEWFALLRAGEASEADVRRWRHWLEASPEHHRGWQMVERVEQQFSMASGDDPDQAEATLARTQLQDIFQQKIFVSYMNGFLTKEEKYLKLALV